MAQTKLGGGRNRGKSREEGEKEKLTFREEGEIGSKSREEGEIGSESREKGDLPPCSTPLPLEWMCGNCHRLATSRRHEFQGRICKAAKRPSERRSRERYVRRVLNK